MRISSAESETASNYSAHWYWLSEELGSGMRFLSVTVYGYVLYQGREYTNLTLPYVSTHSACQTQLEPNDGTRSERAVAYSVCSGSHS